MDTLQSHYARLLGLDDSWRVESVALQIEDRRVEIHLSHVGSGVICPECGVACGLADHANERRWRHLDTMQFETRITAAVPRCGCPACGVKTIAVPWAGNSRIQAIKSAARGFRNFEHYRTRILFFCGKLKLLPDTTHGIP